MSVVDVIIPLLFGVLLVLRPHAFFGRHRSAEEIAAKSATLRRIGWVLLAVAVLYALIAVLESPGGRG